MCDFGQLYYVTFGQVYCASSYLLYNLCGQVGANKVFIAAAVLHTCGAFHDSSGCH